MRLIDLSVSAGRKRQSAQTGFIHNLDAIPLFENVCFAFALFRQKTGESVTQGKELIERILGFQGDGGNFPCFVHEFPACKDPHLGLKIAPILVHILEDFEAVLDRNYKEMIQKALKKMIKPPNNPRFDIRYQALCGKRPDPIERMTARDWFEWIVSDQLFEKGAVYPIPFNQVLQAFTGAHLVQNKKAPETVPLEYILGDSKRLQQDHINQLYAACLYPFSSSIVEETPYTWTGDSRFLWKGSTVHSLVAPKAVRSKEGFVFDLQGSVEVGRDDLFEACLFCDLSEETSLLINGEKGTVFSLGDTVTIATPALKINLRFDAEGEFCGHISRGNRPGQIALHGENQYEAYDWQIGLRTLKRVGPCKVLCTISLSFE